MDLKRKICYFYILFIIFSLVLYIYTAQYMESSIFSPSKDIFWNYLEIPGEEIDIKPDNIVLKKIRTNHRQRNPEDKVYGYHISNISPLGPTGPTIVHFHGSRGNISIAKSLYDVAVILGFNIFLVEYDGYGANNNKNHDFWGGASEFSIKVYDYLVGIIPKENILLWGISLGGAVISYLSKWRPHDHPIILAGTFSSITDILRYHKSLKLKYVWLIENIFYNWVPSKTWAVNITSPVLQIHSEIDDQVSIKSGKILFENISSNEKSWLTISGSHLDPKMNSEEAAELVLFIWKYFPNTKLNKNLDIVSDQIAKIVSYSALPPIF